MNALQSIFGKKRGRVAPEPQPRFSLVNPGSDSNLHHYEESGLPIVISDFANRVPDPILRNALRKALVTADYAGIFQLLQEGEPLYDDRLWHLYETILPMLQQLLVLYPLKPKRAVYR